MVGVEVAAHVFAVIGDQSEETNAFICKCAVK
jgi:hypothetical protein